MKEGSHKGLPLRSRRSIRLDSYDYSQSGAYFLTICTQNRGCVFGEIVEGEMEPNDAGGMVQARWDELATRFADLELDEFVVMPNHVHGIIFVGAPLVGALPGVDPSETNDAAKRAGTRPAPTFTKTILGDVVGAFKSITTHDYVIGVKQRCWPPFPGKLWQRNYYEHIIRNDGSLKHIRQYIVENPARWAFDRENPAVVDPERVESWVR